MNATTSAATATGDHLDAPPYLDPADWAPFAANIAVLPHGGCHLWIGDLRNGRPYWAGRPITGSTRPVPPADVLRYVAMGWLGPHLDLDPADPQAITHACGETLCLPVTRAALLDHLAFGDTPAARRRIAAADIVVDALRTAVPDAGQVLLAYRRAFETHRVPTQPSPVEDSALF